MALVISYNINAQTISAGQILANGYYFDIIPDTLLRVYGHNSYYGSYDLDLNGDKITDFIIKDSYSGGLGGGSGGGFITAQNNNEIAFAFYDSCFSFQPPYNYISRYPMAHAFSFNEPVNNYAAWITPTAYMDYYTFVMYQHNCSYSTFSSTESRFLGLRVFLNADTLYGWVKLKNQPLILEEFACNRNSSNIKEFTGSAVKLYPNPATDHLIIESEKPLTNCMMVMMNLNGQELIKQQINNSKTLIYIGKLPAAVYFVKLISDKTVAIHKIIKE